MGAARRRGLRAAIIAIATSILLISGAIAGGAPASADSGLTAFTSTPTPTLQQPSVGVEDYSNAAGWAPAPDSLTFQWFDNGAPTGVTTYTFTPSDSELGHVLTVAVTAIKAGYPSQTETSDPETVLSTITVSGERFDGNGKPGLPMTVDAMFTPSDVTVTYQWWDQYPTRGPIDGATSATYTPSEADAGDSFYVRVTAMEAGYATINFVLYGQFAYDTIHPEGSYVTGYGTVGATDVSLFDWFPTPASVAYQWLRDGAPIAGATGADYVPTADDAGHTLTAQATASSPGYDDLTVVASGSIPVLPAFDVVPAPAITGSPYPGNTLSVSVPTWTPAENIIRYEWFYNGKQTYDYGPTLQLDGSAVGGTITVAVLASSATRGQTLSPQSAPIVVGINPYRLGAVSIGTVDLNRTVTAHFATPPPAMTTNYQWMRNGEAITGATSATYRPEGVDWNTKLSVQVTVSGAGYVSGSSVSNSELVHSGSLSGQNGTGAVISGEYVGVGSTLHAQSLTIGDPVPGVKVTYEWMFLLPEYKVYYGSTFTVPSSELGQSVYVAVKLSAPHLKSSDWEGTAYTVGAGLFTQHPIPTISGRAVVGAILTAHNGTWTPSAKVTYTYSWYSTASSSASPTLIRGATHATFSVPRSLVGRLITVRVSAHKPFYTSTTETSQATGVTMEAKPERYPNRIFTDESVFH